MKGSLIEGQRWWWLILAALLTAAGYIGVMLWIGWQGVVDALRVIGWPVICAALALSLLNYATRYLRWNWYLRQLGHHLPAFRHLRIYLAGFALTATPGKAGEALRCVLLKPEHVPYGDSLAALLSERISDVLAVLTLSLLVLLVYPQLYPVGVLFAVGCLGFFLLLTPKFQHFLSQWVAGKRGRLAYAARQVMNVVDAARRCHSVALVSRGFAIGILAWGAEGIALWLMLEQVDAGIVWYQAISIYCLAMLAGAASFMPGGLGGAEAAMTAMLVMSGVSLPVAVAVTLVVRLVTLWFAVVIGLVLLLPEFLAGKQPMYKPENSR